MDKHKKNYIFIFSIGIIILFVLSVFLVLGIRRLMTGAIHENDVYLNSSDYIINIEDRLSVSDEFGKSITDDNNHSFGYIEFEIENNVNYDRNFQIYITEKEKEKEINPSYIKFYLTDENDNPCDTYNLSKIPSYVDLNYIDDKPSSKLLLTDSVEKMGTKKYKLRVWIIDSYTVENTDNTFSFEISVRAI